MSQSIVKCLVLFLILTSSQCEESNEAVRKVMDIPSAAKETSGLGMDDSYIFTHNDSGDGPFVYVLDTIKNNISQRVQLIGAKNVDWEDMAVDAGKLYIADTGDNTSNRFMNSVYIVDIDSFSTSGVSLRDYEKIDFTFRSKKDKKKKVNCEAMTVVRDTIYFLSKDAKETDVYMLPPGSDEAEKIGDIKLPFEVTACCQIDEDTFAISGYEKLTDTYYISDVVILTIDELSSWRGVEWKSLDLRLKAQVEGIDYNGGQLFITSEGIGISPGRLMVIKQW
jgi:hypothetical protein